LPIRPLQIRSLPIRTLPIRALLPLLLLGLAWAQELVDQLLFSGRWNLAMGPGQPWWTLFTAPFSHGGFAHLIANSLIFLPLSYLVLSKGLRDYLAVWIGVILMEVPIWLFWPRGSHGMSGVIYGLMGFLIVIGFLERRVISIGLTILGIVFYGGYLPSLLPWNTPAGVSWVGHACGFIGGMIAAGAIFREPNLEANP
jgi:membrane associated rhomboid family serine protease